MQSHFLAPGLSYIQDRTRVWDMLHIGEAVKEKSGMPSMGRPPEPGYLTGGPHFLARGLGTVSLGPILMLPLVLSNSSGVFLKGTWL